MEPFKVLLQRFRTRAGLTLSELAEAVGADRKSIRAWEQGKRVPRDRARLDDLAQVLQLSSTEAATLAAAARSQRNQGVTLAPQTETEATSSSTLSPTPLACHHLRAPVGDFVGRALEIATLRDVLLQALHSGTAICGIQGMGGIGKTELAYRVAHELHATFPDAQILIELRGASATPLTPAQALQTVIRAFSPNAQLTDDLAELQQRYRSLLHQRHVLLLADDARDATQVLPLLPPAGSALLVTSRTRFSLPGMTSIDLEQLSLDDASTMLHQLCPRLNDTEIQALTRACGALPLALRVSGSLLHNDPALSVSDYLARLSDEGHRLSALRDPDDSQLDVTATLALSYDLLDPPAQVLFRQLGVFTADFSTDLAQAVVKLDVEEPVSEVLRRLLRRNLVSYDLTQQRWQMHDLLRDLARTYLESVGEAEAAMWRYAQAAIQFAQSIQDHYLAGGDMTLLALARFDTERPHIDAAQHWADLHTHTPAGDELLITTALATSYIKVLRYDQRQEIIPQWERVRMAAQRRGKRLEEAGALNYLGAAYLRLGEALTAINYFEQALAIFQTIDSPRREAITLNNLGICYKELGKPYMAIRYYEQSLAITQAIGEHRGESHTLTNLSNVYTELGDIHSAIESCTTALSITRAIGDRQEEGYATSYLARIQVLQGHIIEANATFEQACRIFQEVGDRNGEAECQWYFGLALAQRGDGKHGLPLLRVALAYRQEIRHAKVAEHAALIAHLEGGKELPAELRIPSNQRARGDNLDNSADNDARP